MATTVDSYSVIFLSDQNSYMKRLISLLREKSVTDLWLAKKTWADIHGELFALGQ